MQKIVNVWLLVLGITVLPVSRSLHASYDTQSVSINSSPSCSDEHVASSDEQVTACCTCTHEKKQGLSYGKTALIGFASGVGLVVITVLSMLPF